MNSVFPFQNKGGLGLVKKKKKEKKNKQTNRQIVKEGITKELNNLGILAK